MTLLALFSTLVGVVVSSEPPGFSEWVAEYGRNYTTDEEHSQAAAAFALIDEVLQLLNADQDDGAEYAHNEFSDFSPEKFKNSRFPGHMHPELGLKGGELVAGLQMQAPDSFDWREKGAITPVKDQGPCGSCWAESAVGNIESLWYLANKATLNAPVPLSVEQVIECDGHDYACYGGYPNGAFKYVIERGGISSEASYAYIIQGRTICLANQTYNETCGDGACDDPPLTNHCDLTCSDKLPTHKVTAKIQSWQAITSGEDAMASYAAQYGPISVGVDASGEFGAFVPWLQSYKRGIANPKHCTDQIDHAVLIVGYGVDASTKYWIIKNSWGSKWGESGYFRLVRGIGKCGVALMATSAVVSGSADVLLADVASNIVV